MVFCSECDTLYPDLAQPSKNQPVTLTHMEDRLVCPSCRVPFEDYFFLKAPFADKYRPTADQVIAAGFSRLLSAEQRRACGLA